MKKLILPLIFALLYAQESEELVLKIRALDSGGFVYEDMIAQKSYRAATIELPLKTDFITIFDRFVLDAKTRGDQIKKEYIEKPLEKILPDGANVEVSPNYNIFEIVITIPFALD